MYDATKKDNLKLTGLKNQVVEMESDFEEMMRVRNEAKKRLEEQFKDVYQYIHISIFIFHFLGKSKTINNIQLMRVEKLMSH